MTDISPTAAPTAADDAPQVHWLDDEGLPQAARWRSLAGHPPPQRVILADDALSADAAWRLAKAGTGLLWRGDYQNARHLLQALSRRVDAHTAPPTGRRPPDARSLDRRAAGQPASAPAAAKPAVGAAAADPAPAAPDPITLNRAFHALRKAQALRARILGALLLPFDADHGLPLRRAPDMRAAGLQAHGPVDGHYVASLRELLGLVGAYEWRKNGVPITALKAAIHPHHGVFSPLRGEYVDLVAKARLPAAAKPARVLDVGTGTGVLAAVLARRGLKVVATDNSAAALACAADNLQRLELTGQVTLQQADLFVKGHFGLVVCNPPWLPALPSSPLEAALYDPESRMLRGFLAGLASHLAPAGEGWLILSDLAEHLGLRRRDELLGWISDAGLQVLARQDTRPQHRKAADASDPLHAARAAELTSLWRLGPI